MATRTNVRLTIRKADQAKLEAICDDADEVNENYTPPGDPETLEYVFHDINFANLDFEEELRDQKIPYDKSWDQGGDYEAGTEYHRINKDSESVVKEFQENTESMVLLEEVVKAVEQGSLEKFIEQKTNEFYVIPWEEQEKILCKES